MWNELVDDKGRVRASFFYKGAFYDRDAFINFNTRYSIEINKYLKQEEKGRYEMQKVDVKNPLYGKGVTKEVIGRFGFGELVRIYRDQDGYEREFSNDQPQYLSKREQVWIPKYKNDYEERNNTPHYYTLLDCGVEFFSTKDKPVYFKKKYNVDKHEIWWSLFDGVTNKLRGIAIKKLNNKFPNWEDINAYWD